MFWNMNKLMGRYVPQMNGVLLAHWEHELLDDTVNIINECPFGVCEVQFYSILWAPKVGQKLCKLLASLYLSFKLTVKMVPTPSRHLPTSPSYFRKHSTSPSHYNISLPILSNLNIPRLRTIWTWILRTSWI